MPKQKRVIDPNGGVYHIVSRGNNRNAVFHDQADYRFFHEALLHQKGIMPYRMFRYALMPNHFHLQVSVGPEVSISELMKEIKQKYATYHHRKYRTSGHVFQGRYRSYLIVDIRYLVTCAAYIDLNPVKAGLCDSAENYAWSSAACYAGNWHDPLVDMGEFHRYLSLFGDSSLITLNEHLQLWTRHPITKKEARRYFMQLSRNQSSDCG